MSNRTIIHQARNTLLLPPNETEAVDSTKPILFALFNSGKNHKILAICPGFLLGNCLALKANFLDSCPRRIKLIAFYSNLRGEASKLVEELVLENRPPREKKAPYRFVKDYFEPLEERTVSSSVWA